MPAEKVSNGLKSVFFGTSPGPYDRGIRPACALNGNNVAVEVHEGESSSSLNYLVADVDGPKVTFRAPVDNTNYDSGYDPTVALTDGGLAIEVHGASRDDGLLYYNLGQVDAKTGNIKFPRKNATPILGGGTNEGYDPSIALRPDGSVVLVYNSDRVQKRALYYRVGTLKDGKLSFGGIEDLKRTGSNDQRTVGTSPSVAVNAQGQIVAVYESEGTLHYLFGQLQANGTATWSAPRPYGGGSITMGTQQSGPTMGTHPSVALTDDAYVYEVHHDSDNNILQRVGRFDPAKGIEWQSFLEEAKLDYVYDDGERPQIAANGKIAIQVHESETDRTLFSNGSLMFDRANWMGDHSGALAAKSLRQIVVPASHDAGAYTDNAAQTQNLTFYGQLSCGVRYFDVRPKYTGDLKKPYDRSKYFTYHDIPRGDELGPRLVDAFQQIARFLRDHRELVIVKISHYSRFNQDAFDEMVNLIEAAVGSYLFTRTDQDTARLADLPLSRYSARSGGTLLVVADVNTDNGVDYITAARPTRIFRYRDWYAADPEKGDLTVFDIYSDTTSLSELTYSESPNGDHDDIPGSTKKVPRGQIPKFKWFDGFCQGRGNRRSTTPCDLFLLSWTLTASPVRGRPVRFARPANAVLVQEMAKTPITNDNGRIINMLYTDAVENARSVDVALIRNGLWDR